MIYSAQAGDEWTLIVDGKEGGRYEGGIISEEEGAFFSTPRNFHYFAFKNKAINFVEEILR